MSRWNFGEMLKSYIKQSDKTKVGGIKKLLPVSGISLAAYKAGFFYVFLSFLNKSLAVILLPILTHKLSTEDFGYLTIFSNTLIVLQSILYFGVVQSFSADYFKDGKAALEKTFLSYLFVPFTVAALLLLAIFTMGGYITAKTGFPYQVLLLIPLIALSNLLYELLLALFRNEKREKFFAAITLGRTIAEISLVFIFVIWLQKNWWGRVHSIFYAYLLLGLISLYIFRKRNFLNNRIQPQVIKKELLFGTSVLITQISFLAISSFDKFFVNFFYGESNTGIYGLSFTIATINTMVSGALMQFFIPVMYEALASGNKTKQLNKIFSKYAGLMLCISILQALLIPLFYKLFIDDKFHEGIKYSLIITISSFLWSLSYFCFQVLYYYKSKRKLIITSTALFLTGLIVNYIFIKEFYLTGAAIGACVIHLIVLGFLLAFTRQQIFRKNQSYA
jgi:O-antigen/teichoic acid export membrane protein